jgi:hypothetical protein
MFKQVKKMKDQKKERKKGLDQEIKLSCISTKLGSFFIAKKYDYSVTVWS